MFTYIESVLYNEVLYYRKICVHVCPVYYTATYECVSSCPPLEEGSPYTYVVNRTLGC